MAGCVECRPTGGEQDIEFQSKQKEAKQHAVTNEKNVFLYKDDMGHWQFIEEGPARAIGIQPTGGIVSYLQPVTA